MIQFPDFGDEDVDEIDAWGNFPYDEYRDRQIRKEIAEEQERRNSDDGA